MPDSTCRARTSSQGRRQSMLSTAGQIQAALPRHSKSAKPSTPSPTGQIPNSPLLSLPSALGQNHSSKGRRGHSPKEPLASAASSLMCLVDKQLSLSPLLRRTQHSQYSMWHLCYCLPVAWMQPSAVCLTQLWYSTPCINCARLSARSCKGNSPCNQRHCQLACQACQIHLQLAR